MVLLLLHDLLGSQNLSIVSFILLLEVIPPIFIKLMELVQLLIVHFSNGTPVVMTIRVYTLGVEIWTNRLCLKFLVSPDAIDFDYPGIGVDVLSGGKLL